MIDIIEHNAILYYADYLRLKEESKTVTDNCKYYFIYGSPINSAYLVDLQPFYDENDKYYIQAYQEYNQVKTKFGQEGAISYVKDICNLAALGCIDAYQMLNCIHYYSGKFEKKEALKQYEKWINNQVYTHLETDEKGDPQRTECTRYVAHTEYGTNTYPEVSYTSKSPTKSGVHERP